MFLAVLMILTVMFSVLTAQAVSQAQIDALQESKSQLESKAKDIQSKINVLTEEQGRYIDRKAALDEQCELTRQEIELINQQIELYDKLIEEKAVELEEAQKKEREQYELFRTRIRSMEENGSMSYLAVIFRASSFSDLLSRIADVSDIMEYDKRLEDDYIAAREYVQKVKAEYEETQRQQEQYRSELLEKEAQLEEQVQAAAAMIAALEENIDEFTKAFEENAAAEREVQSQIDSLIKQKQAEEAAKAAAAQKGSSGGSVKAGKGTFIWPAPSSYSVSSPYGYRIHPIFGTERFHAGIDIGASAGDQILAAAGGTVSIATYSSSYGNYVMISHGGGNATLYAHMSSRVVSAGDSVKQGDVIGYVGSTGWSTGPHLHFEIRINNALVNPMDYFN
jgi:murein DD-endopeptidase MepM/ murein hydrolase activator NlpD